MNTTNTVTFRVQIFSGVDHGVVIHTETHTCTADTQREMIDALEARLRWCDHHWHIQAM